MRVGRSGSVVLALVVLACDGVGARPTPASAPAPGATTRLTSAPASAVVAAPGTGGATTLAFESHRYGYSLRLPAGWYVRDEAAGEWGPAELSYVGAGTDAFEEDYAGRGATPDHPGVTYGLYLSSADVPASTTLDDWMALLGATVRRASSCRGDPEAEATTIGGEPAAVLVYERADCSLDHHAIVIGTIHARRGYAMTWLTRAGEADPRRELLESILDSFRFTR